MPKADVNSIGIIKIGIRLYLFPWKICFELRKKIIKVIIVIIVFVSIRFLPSHNNNQHRYPSLQWSEIPWLNIRQTSNMVISSQRQTQKAQLKTSPSKATPPFRSCIAPQTYIIWNSSTTTLGVWGSNLGLREKIKQENYPNLPEYLLSSNYWSTLVCLQQYIKLWPKNLLCERNCHYILQTLPC